jgi:hypothetical protein
MFNAVGIIITHFVDLDLKSGHVCHLESWILRYSLNMVIHAMSKLALEPTQPPVQWILGALPLGVKRQG